MTKAAIPLLLLADRDVPGSMGSLVYYEGTPTAKRGLLAAVRFAVPCSSGVTVLIDGAHPELAERAQVEISVSFTAPAYHWRILPPIPAMSLLRAVNEEQSGIFVLGSRTLLNN